MCVGLIGNETPVELVDSVEMNIVEGGEKSDTEGN